MSPKSFLLDEQLHAYLLAHTTGIDDVARQLIEETAGLGGIAEMQIAPEQGAFLSILTAAVGARRVVEVGTFTGFSALCIARALPPDGRLLCLDVSAEWTAIAQRYWQAAGVTDKIELVLAPAADTLHALPDEPSFDFAFIDADKQGYLTYYEEVLPRVRPGGLILVDNTLWSGKVVDEAADDDTVKLIRAFNDHVAADARVESTILPISDGLTMIRKP
ncbi:MAG: putative O-methyltransferase [Pseudonocardia sp.]|nr:putative O-methyltransferase [Pseudonocardia sp.]